MGSAQPIVRWMHWLEALNFRLSLSESIFIKQSEISAEREYAGPANF